MNAQVPFLPASADEAAINRLRRALVRFFNRKCGNPAEAEDLAQDVLTRSLSRIDWQSPDAAKGYVFRAALGTVFNVAYVGHEMNVAMIEGKVAGQGPKLDRPLGRILCGDRYQPGTRVPVLPDRCSPEEKMSGVW